MLKSSPLREPARQHGTKLSAVASACGTVHAHVQPCKGACKPAWQKMVWPTHTGHSQIAHAVIADVCSSCKTGCFVNCANSCYGLVNHKPGAWRASSQPIQAKRRSAAKVLGAIMNYLTASSMHLGPSQTPAKGCAAYAAISVPDMPPQGAPSPLLQIQASRGCSPTCR